VRRLEFALLEVLLIVQCVPIIVHTIFFREMDHANH
jgi:hypothetical protein